MKYSSVQGALLAGFLVVLAVVLSWWVAKDTGPVVVAPQTAAPSALPSASSGAGLVRHITARGDGRRDGADVSNAARLEGLPRLLEVSQPGDEVWIHAGDEPYRQDGPIALTSGGAPGQPVVVRGVGEDGSRPEIVGSRSVPFDPEGATGKEVFRLLEGADHLRFEHLAFRNQGNGCFRIGADIDDLTITDVEAHNVARFVENTASGDRPTATITGLTVTDATVRGYSDGAVRLRYDTSDVLLADVDGDAEAQEQREEDFPIGVELEDTAHDVELHGVTMRNHRSERGEDDYWNGDGFTAERGTYDLNYVDTYAAGNSDAGYDLKSASTTLLRAVAEDNSRNYRLWGEDIEVRDCVGRSPHRRGGNTTQAQVHGSGATGAVLIDCTFADADGRTIVFDVDEGAVQVQGGEVRHAPDASLRAVEDGANLTLVGVAVEVERGR